MEKPPRQLFRIVFWSGIRSNGPKMLIFGPKCQFWAKFGRFWAPNPIFWGQGVKILVPSYRDSNETPFSCWRHWSARLQLAARGENVLFWPQNLDIWGQKSIFCLVIAIFVDGANDHYTRGYNFPIGTTPKKISVSELGVHFSGLTSAFWPFQAIPTSLVQVPLILDLGQQNLLKPSGPSKNDSQWQRTWFLLELRRNGRFYVRPKNVFLAKSCFFQKEALKIC